MRKGRVSKICFSLILSVCMVFTMMPSVSWAANDGDAPSVDTQEPAAVEQDANGQGNKGSDAANEQEPVIGEEDIDALKVAYKNALYYYDFSEDFIANEQTTDDPDDGTISGMSCYEDISLLPGDEPYIFLAQVDSTCLDTDSTYNIKKFNGGGEFHIDEFNGNPWEESTEPVVLKKDATSSEPNKYSLKVSDSASFGHYLLTDGNNTFTVHISGEDGSNVGEDSGIVFANIKGDNYTYAYEGEGIKATAIRDYLSPQLQVLPFKWTVTVGGENVNTFTTSGDTITISAATVDSWRAAGHDECIITAKVETADLQDMVMTSISAYILTSGMELPFYDSELLVDDEYFIDKEGFGYIYNAETGEDGAEFDLEVKDVTSNSKNITVEEFDYGWVITGKSIGTADVTVDYIRWNEDTEVLEREQITIEVKDAFWNIEFENTENGQYMLPGSTNTLDTKIRKKTKDPLKGHIIEEYGYELTDENLRLEWDYSLNSGQRDALALMPDAADKSRCAITAADSISSETSCTVTISIYDAADTGVKAKPLATASQDIVIAEDFTNIWLSQADISKISSLEYGETITINPQLRAYSAGGSADYTLVDTAEFSGSMVADFGFGGTVEMSGDGGLNITRSSYEECILTISAINIATDETTEREFTLKGRTNTYGGFMDFGFDRNGYSCFKNQDSFTMYAETASFGRIADSEEYGYSCMIYEPYQQDKTPIDGVTPEVGFHGTKFFVKLDAADIKALAETGCIEANVELAITKNGAKVGTANTSFFINDPLYEITGEGSYDCGIYYKGQEGTFNSSYFYIIDASFPEGEFIRITSAVSDNPEVFEVTEGEEGIGFKALKTGSANLTFTYEKPMKTGTFTMPVTVSEAIYTSDLTTDNIDNNMLVGDTIDFTYDLAKTDATGRYEYPDNMDEVTISCTLSSPNESAFSLEKDATNANVWHLTSSDEGACTLTFKLKAGEETVAVIKTEVYAQSEFFRLVPTGNYSNLKVGDSFFLKNLFTLKAFTTAYPNGTTNASAVSGELNLFECMEEPVLESYDENLFSYNELTGKVTVVNKNQKLPAESELYLDVFYSSDGMDVEYLPYLHKVTVECSHKSKTTVKAKSATCLEGGNIRHYHCNDCDRYYSDYYCKDEVDYDTQVVIQPLGHNAVHVPAKAPTCTDTGLKEHYKCDRCKLLFETEEAALANNPTTTEELTVPATNHPNKIFKAATPAQINKPGNKAAWYCPDCDKYFTDNTCDTEIARSDIEIPGITISLAKTKYTYTGSQIKPQVVVKDENGKSISEDSYIVEYNNNKNAGKGSVYVELSGDYIGSTELEFTIAKADLTVKVNNKSKIYGEANPEFNATISGFVGDENERDLGGALALDCDADSGSDAGKYAIEGSGLVSDNYNVVYDNGILTVKKAGLTITAQNAIREYGDPNPEFEVSYKGFVNGDDESVLGGNLKISCDADNWTNYGTYKDDIIPSGLTAKNYDITFVKGDLTITRAHVILTVKDTSKTYGSANPKFQMTAEGFKNGRTMSILKGTPVYTTTANTSSAVGEYEVKVKTGYKALTNYTMEYRPGTLTVKKATLTATVKDMTKEYLEEVPAHDKFGVSFSGFKNGDTSKVVSGEIGEYVHSVDKNSAVGTYKVNVNEDSSTLTAANYNFKYAPGEFTVTKATQKLSADVPEENHVIKDGTTYNVLRVGDSCKLTVTGDMEGSDISYKSSDSKIVSVSSNGTLTAKKKGIATITYKATSTKNYNSATKTVKIYVPGKLSKATLKKTSMTYTGKEQKPTATVKYGSATVKSKYYTIDYKNNLNSGTATATIKGDDIYYYGQFEKEFTIKPAKQSLKLSLDATTIYVGTAPAKVTVKGALCDPDDLLFDTEDPSVATVDNNGVVTAEGTGKTYITVLAPEEQELGNYSEATSRIAITVKKPTSVDSLKITLGTKSYTYDGKAKKPKVTVKDGRSTLKVDSSYTLEYRDNVEVGTASVTIKAKSRKYIGEKTLEYTIKKGTQTIELEPVYTTGTLQLGDEFNINASPKDKNTVLSYVSSNSDIAEIDDEGNITAKAVGTVKITVNGAETDNCVASTASITFKVGTMGVAMTENNGLAPGSKSFTVRWNNPEDNVSGFQIRYATRENMGNAKTVTIKDADARSKTVSKLTAKKKYYVQVRSFIVKDNVTYYSRWSRPTREVVTK